METAASILDFERKKREANLYVAKLIRQEYRNSRLDFFLSELSQTVFPDDQHSLEEHIALPGVPLEAKLIHSLENGLVIYQCTMDKKHISFGADHYFLKSSHYKLLAEKSMGPISDASCAKHQKEFEDYFFSSGL